MMDDTLKQRYPFRLGTTSFIYPADYASNVRQLAPLVDEIELLLLESNHLPSHGDINELQSLAQVHNITYNIHLPIDIDLGADMPAIRRQCISSIAKAMDRVAPLHPTTHTLHLPFNQPQSDLEHVGDWQIRSMESLTWLLDATGAAADQISIETLDFSPDWLLPIVEMFDLSVCVDVGHLILHGFDLQKVLDVFADRTTILHLHGVCANRDHLAVSHIEPDDRRTISRYLMSFKESVSIEVFSLSQLEESMACFPELVNFAI
jgi:sugar phosphate isomerase/epimerase